MHNPQISRPRTLFSFGLKQAVVYGVFIVCVVMGPRVAVAQTFDEFSQRILEAVLHYHQQNAKIDPNSLIQYTNRYNGKLQTWWVGMKTGNAQLLYLGRIDPQDNTHPNWHIHIPMTPQQYENGHNGGYQNDVPQLVLDFDHRQLKDKNWKQVVVGKFIDRADVDTALCEGINGSLEPLRAPPGVGSKKNPFVPRFLLGSSVQWGPYRGTGGAIEVGTIPQGTEALMVIPSLEAMALHYASAALNSQWAQGAYSRVDSALSPYESWGHLKSQGGNFRASGVGGFAGEVANQYGYGRTAAAIGLGANVIGGYAANGSKGVGSNLGATVAETATQMGVAYLGGNEMQAGGAGRLAGLATASLGGPQGAITYGVSTVGSDIGSIAASYASARKNGMSTGTFVGETVSNYWTYFGQYFGY